MGNNKKVIATPDTLDDMKLELIAVTDKSSTAVRRTLEIKELLVKMILLGRKRGRPSLKNEDVEYAA